jgi:hypothetical protein
MSRHLLAFASVAATLAGAAGCAGTGPGHGRVPTATARLADPSSPDASGVWDWMFRSTDDQGDMRVEQEEWHLAQKGSRIEGWYDRAVTMMSVDERLFRCNQRLGFTKTTRVRVAGQIEGDRVMLREVGFDAKPGPCDDGARNLVAYVGVLRGPTLALRWGPEAGQTLVRRTDGARSPLTQQTEAGAPAVQRASLNTGEPAAPVGGTWVWELRSIDAEGDERLEREEWHLSETDDGIVGYYDRTVRRERAEGTFESLSKTCKVNKFQTTTRYLLRGVRTGSSFSVREVDSEATPSECDNGKRRLDNYSGQVTDPDSLSLSWGPGYQLLRRKR